MAGRMFWLWTHLQERPAPANRHSTALRRWGKYVLVLRELFTGVRGRGNPYLLCKHSLEEGYIMRHLAAALLCCAVPCSRVPDEGLQRAARNSGAKNSGRWGAC